MHQQHIITDYPGLVRAIAIERKRRGYSQLAFDDHVGLADGHTAKIEAGYRSLGPLTLPLVLQALGCALVLAPIRTTVHHRRTDIPGQIPLPIEMPTRAEIAKANAPRRRSSKAKAA